MRTLIAGLAMAALCVPVLAQEQENAPINAAKSAALQWLAVNDLQDYKQSWTNLSPAANAKVTQATWDAGLMSVRTPLGAVVSRKLASAEYTRKLPGAPEGEYVVLQYNTNFEKKPGAVETVTPMRNADGSWQVSGYFIK